MSSDQPIEPAPPTPAAGPVPGWYADPADPALQRYWDGAAWTSHTHPVVAAPAWPATGGQAAAAPMYGAPSYAVPATYAVPAGYAPVPRQVGFREAISRAFAGWKDYSSRSTVAEYWWFYLFQMLVMIVPYVIFLVLLLAAVPGLAASSSTSTSGDVLTREDAPSTGLVATIVIFGILYALLAIGFFLVHLPLAVRRLHDTDREGWWYLLSLVPFGSIVVLVFTILPGTPGPNRYGPVPT